MLLDLHTDSSGGRSGGLVFPSLSEFSAVCCDLHSQRLWRNQYSRNRCFSGTLIVLCGLVYNSVLLTLVNGIKSYSLCLESFLSLWLLSFSSTVCWKNCICSILFLLFLCHRLVDYHYARHLKLTQWYVNYISIKLEENLKWIHNTWGESISALYSVPIISLFFHQ